MSHCTWDPAEGDGVTWTVDGVLSKGTAPPFPTNPTLADVNATKGLNQIMAEIQRRRVQLGLSLSPVYLDGTDRLTALWLLDRRNDINLIRTVGGMAAYSWTGALASGVPALRAEAITRVNTITALRQALDVPTILYWTMSGYNNWIATCNPYPTILSQVVSSGSGYVGKFPFSGDSSQRQRCIFYRSAGLPKIPSGIVSARVLVRVVVRNTLLESFGSLKVYLCPNGTNPALVGSYDPTLSVLLGSKADADLPGGDVLITLDASVLAARAGDDLTLLFTTSVEEVGAGLDPSVPADLNSYIGSTILTVQFTLSS